MLSQEQNLQKEGQNKVCQAIQETMPVLSQERSTESQEDL
jgi:hypothetical protein